MLNKKRIYTISIKKHNHIDQPTSKDEESNTDRDKQWVKILGSTEYHSRKRYSN